MVGMRTPRSIYLPSRGRYSYIYIKLPSPPGPIMVGTASWEDGVGPLPPCPPGGGGEGGGRRRGIRSGGPEGWGRECRVVLGVEKTPVGLARMCHGSVAKLCLLLGGVGGLLVRLVLPVVSLRVCCGCVRRVGACLLEFVRQGV